MADYKLLTDNATWWNCTCQYGWTVTGVCINVTACVSAVKVGGAPTCLFCNSLNYFVVTNGGCVCQTGYKQIGDNCSIVCGDGIVISTSEGCDDGNNNDGDGCSSICATEDRYNCSFINGNYKCQYKGNFTVSLAYILKSETANSATYFFNIDPTPYNLQINNSFGGYVHIPARYTVYTFVSSSYADGMLMVNVDFTGDLEGYPATLYVGFDPSYFNSSLITYNFSSVGTNQPLIISYYAYHLFYLKIMAYAIVCLGGLLLLVSAGLEKMVGIETVNVLQIVVFSKLVYVQKDILVSGGIVNLKYINGYNDVGKNMAHTNDLPITFRRLSFNSDFILNFQTGIFLMGLSLIMLLIMELYKWRTMTQLRRTKRGSTD
jgi:cysteine-rich repeat protein